MEFEVAPASDDDVRQIIHIMFKAYGGKNEYINAVFPRGLTPEGEDLTAQRLLFIKNIAPGIKWEKVTDSANGSIVGGAMWALHEDAKPQRFPLDGPPGTWESDAEKEYAQALFNSLGVDEHKYYEENELPFMRLVIMAIEPAYQRRGAGAELLKSGLKVADEAKAATTLIASPEGKGLYEKHSFTTIQERDLDVPERFSEKPKYHIWSMVRPRKHT
ncbi:hypothetical protein HBI56_027440 [Parastagonospora nodorum]|nr:hypothetical protein HBI10_019180 [Parastagonospora nodorum]KAH4015328.1 hypothetical protein HBI13_161460 [Parastagonospora nodorum]KAH4025404.1 hypothetical protein HBI09_153040 [Parastagonospora nodorum]KAH4200623.1 hypothetical protein HBI95_172030 [Parastagonospora nodorum]KAH4203997.1 hypothetical protein HBH42_008510 [Parastagonospora nodorum]